MMRTMIIVGLALALAPTATAQEGCSEADPCSWVVDLDADGMDLRGPDGSPSDGLNGTQGDWYTLDVFNYDGVPHTLRIDSLDLAWDFDAADGYETAPFQLTPSGEHTLLDDPSGDTAVLRVLVNDVVDVEGGQDPITDDGLAADGGEDAGRGAPALGAWALLIALALVGLLVHRR